MATITSKINQSFKEPNIAASYGPYSASGNKTALKVAHDTLSADRLNIIGMTVGIVVDENTIEEYWYQGGTNLVNLVKKQSSDVEANPTGEATTPLNKIKIGKTNYNTGNPFAGDVQATDAERLQALANVSNQEAGYDSSEPPVFTGKMGYVVLQPEKAGNATTSFAAQIANKPNTIFEIRDVFDLGGTQETPVSVTIPDNCTLKFNGGMIKNGTINGNKTIIDAQITKIFDTSIGITGTWNVKDAYPEWFGAIGDGVIDDTAALTNCFLLKCQTKMTGDYLISESVRLYNSINGKGASVKYGADCNLYATNLSDFYMKNLYIDGQYNSRYGIRFDSVKNVVIDNCTIQNIGNANINQTSALRFNNNSNCKNIIIQNCTIKNVTHDSTAVSQASVGINFNNDAGVVENSNNGLYVSNCRFEGFNLAWQDSDCIKILSDNGVDTNVVITGCFFTGIGKRAVKTQAIGVKLIGNTYEVKTTVLAVIGFQRGYCQSLNDTLIVDPAEGQTSETFLENVFEIGYGNVDIIDFNTIVKNYVSGTNGSKMKFINIAEFGGTTFKNLKVSDCVVGHIGMLLGFGSATNLEVSSVDMHNITISNPNVYVSKFNSATPKSLSNCRFENIGVLNPDVKVLDGIDFNKVNNSTFIFSTYSNTFGGSNNTLVGKRNFVKIYYTNTDSGNVSSIEYFDGRITKAYLKNDTDIGGSSSSSSGALRDGAAKVGTILYIPTPSISGNDIKIGYILTSNSANGGSVGTTAVYSYTIPTQITNT